MLRRLVAVLASAAALLVASPALAHWCNCLWASGYNLVVRPAQDTVTVPGSGSATLDLFVQNNMGYPLLNFVLTAKASGYTVNVTGATPKVANYLMPGEKLKRTLTISKSGGGSLAVESIDFYVSFGNSGQSGAYGVYNSPHNAVAVRKADGTLAPTGFGGLRDGGDQGMYLRNMAEADFGDLASALDDKTTTTGTPGLMEEYCAGRGSWDHGNASSITGTYCPNDATTTCPARYTKTTLTKFDAQHLWSATALAERKAVLGPARTAALRKRFVCGWADDHPAARYLAAFALGYLGDDATARTFLEGVATGSGSAADKNVAKSALLMMGQSQYSADVNACAVPSGDSYAASVCAAAVGIAEKKDGPVNDVLLARARWECPGECDSGDPADPTGFFASHLLSVVSWDRRGYAAGSADTVSPSYFNTGPVDAVAPAAPTGVGCVANAGGTIRVNWTAVTKDVNGGTETGVSYKVYSDTSAHAGCAKPSDPGCNYAHADAASGIYRDFTGLDGTKTYRYRVTALDGAGNESAFSSEVECTPKFAPVAALTCTPATGDAPLDVTCDASASTDGNGAADITAFAFKLDSGAEESGTAKTKAYSFPAAGGHVVTVKVTDSTGQSSSKTANIDVTTPGNKAPTADATGSPLTGPAPLAVAFDGSGSSDPEDGTNLTFSWDFGDSSPKATTAKPSHTYQSAGTFTATLTVTDTAGAPSSAVLTVKVTGNSPPDVDSASASPTSGAAPLVVHFDATGVTDPDGDAVTLTWDFGDGSAVSHEKAVDHTYPTTGTFTAKLSAQDDGQPAIGPAEATFTITPGQANRPPECAKASVTPTSGNAPLTLHLDASGCTDPDNNVLSFEWRIPTTLTTPDVVYTQAVVDHEMTAQAASALPLSPEIHLSVKDDGSPSLETNRDWPISITTGSTPGSDGGTDPGPVSSGCGCGASASAPGGLGLALLALGLLRRRR